LPASTSICSYKVFDGKYADIRENVFDFVIIDKDFAFESLLIVTVESEEEFSV